MIERNEQLVRDIATTVVEVLRARGIAIESPVASKVTPCSLAHGVAAAGPVTAPAPMAAPPTLDLARYIDHTLLKPSATEEEVRKVCEEARQYHFASVCVNSCHVALVARELSGSGVKVCTVVGFPLGAMSSRGKAAETAIAIEEGAEEIDMVINVGRLKAGDHRFILDDIKAVVAAARGRLVKVILETSMLNEREKIAACVLSKEAGAHFVKTSTGFGGGGATAEDIALMRRVVGPEMGVKASGGIRDRETAERMVAAGASRLGCSASIAIVTGGKSTSSY